jgi:pyruvate kinase
MISRLSAKVLCTLGPASLTRKVIVRLSEAGVSLFRINMSHTSIEDLVPTLAFIRKHSPVPICIDLEGAQVRTGRVSKGGVDVKDGMILHLAENPPSGAPPSSAEGDLSIYPSGTLEKIVVGDLISIDFNEVLVQAIGKADSGLTVRVLSGGSIGSNKAVTVHRDIFLPMLTLKDKQALDVGLAHGVRHVALSDYF